MALGEENRANCKFNGDVTKKVVSVEVERDREDEDEEQLCGENDLDLNIFFGTFL